jgi:hypothetical protein
MVTIAIQGGRHDRLRPGDIVGALTTGVGIAGTDIGQITVNDRISLSQSSRRWDAVPWTAVPPGGSRTSGFGRTW